MPKNIGKYEQGGMLTQPDFGPEEAGVPGRAKPAGPVPRGQQHDREENSTVGANDVHMH